MRPLGVTLVGFYQILRGLLSLLLGLSLLLFSGLAAKLASLAAEGSAVERFMHSAGHVAGLSVIVFGVIHILAGYGVLQMQNWGRLLTLFFSAVGLVLVLPWLFTRTFLRCSSERLMRRASFIWPCLRSNVSSTPNAAARCGWRPEGQFSVLRSQHSLLY